MPGSNNAGRARPRSARLHRQRSGSEASSEGATMPVLLGTAPDSWGVWHPNDPLQTPWHRFLDEVVEAGYVRIELGPFGYLPTDPAVLRPELERRGLTLAGATFGGALHEPAA